MTELEGIRNIPFKDRGNLRSLSDASGVSLTTLHRRVKEGKVKRVTTNLLPMITDRFQSYVIGFELFRDEI